MLKAAEKAEEINNNNLSEMIRKEIKEYKCGRKIRAKDMYNRIYDAVNDCPKISYKKLIKSIAKENGMYPEEFERYYKKCREVYNEAKEEFRLYEEAQKKFKKLIGYE